MGDLLGNAVRFGVVDDVLAAGEGIETMLSLRCVLSAMPMAAALSANHLSAMSLPSGLRRLYIARDDDAAGDAVQATLTRRAKAAGVEAIALLPRLDDFNEDYTPSVSTPSEQSYGFNSHQRTSSDFCLLRLISKCSTMREFLTPSYSPARATPSSASIENDRLQERAKRNASISSEAKEIGLDALSIKRRRTAVQFVVLASVHPALRYDVAMRAPGIKWQRAALSLRDKRSLRYCVQPSGERLVCPSCKISTALILNRPKRLWNFSKRGVD